MDDFDIKLCFRVRDLRKELKMNQTEFGDKLDVSQSYLTNIENGKRPVTTKIFKLICLQSWNGKSVNETWLRTGEGEMFQPLPPEDEVAAAVSNVLEDINCDNSIYTLIKELLLKYDRLDPKSKKVIDEYADDIIKGYIKKREEH